MIEYRYYSSDESRGAEAERHIAKARGMSVEEFREFNSASPERREQMIHTFKSRRSTDLEHDLELYSELR